jgi:hypothetical protein
MVSDAEYGDDLEIRAFTAAYQVDVCNWSPATLMLISANEGSFPFKDPKAMTDTTRCQVSITNSNILNSQETRRGRRNTL